MTEAQRTNREVHLVGSIPANTTELAMRWAIQELGPLLSTIPDGEVADRSTWIKSQEPRLATSEDLQLMRSGTWSSYMDLPRYGVRPHHRLRSTSLDLQYAHYAIMGRWQLDELQRDGNIPDRPLLVGIPSPYDLAIFMLGAIDGWRSRVAFRDATATEIYETHQAIKTRVVYQLEMPLETVTAIKSTSLPAPARLRLYRSLARGVHKLVKQTPVGTRWAVHLCFGDLQSSPVTRPTSMRPLVELATELIDDWPIEQNPLVSFHLPMCDGQIAPVMTHPEFYQPLRGLRSYAQPGITTFHAGLAHLRTTIEEQREVLDCVEGYLESYVGIASPCGLGRMDMERASRLAARYRELAAIA